VRIDYAPTLELQRELYAMPRDRERFDRYISDMRGGTEDLALPPLAFNRIGREHFAEALTACARSMPTGSPDARSRRSPIYPRAELCAPHPSFRTLSAACEHRPSASPGSEEDDALLKRKWAVPLACGVD
jgi:hypothetical protein